MTDLSVERFEDRIAVETVGPCTVFVLETPVDRVVSWKGSVATYPNFAEDDDLLQDLAVSMLDKGTQHRDRFEVADVLEGRGAQLSFNGNGFRLQMQGKALRADLDEVFGVMAEQLRAPLFDPEEFEKVRAQAVASLHRALENTGSQASGALSRLLYRPAHPNFEPDPREQIAMVEAATLEQIRSFHERYVGARQFLLAVAGDVDLEEVTAAVERHFGDWDEPAERASFETEGREAGAEERRIPMPDKQNIDVRLGHGLRLRRTDADYLPLYVANYILGGNFSARLMARVRDDLGLTYGIGSGLQGISPEYDGHWRVGVTLSRENVERGIEETRAVVERFVEGGVTADELDEKQTTLSGLFAVGLSSTSGLASAILRNAERGFETSYLDEFNDLVHALTTEQVNEVVRRHLDPEAMHVALAGELMAERPN